MLKQKEEIEVKYLEIDKQDIEKKLKEIGATKVGDFFLRHISFDYPDYRLDKDNSWIRLRDEQKQVILAYKKRMGVSSQDGSINDEGMLETEVKVDSYDNTRVFLKNIGLIEKHGEAQKKRTKWKKGNIIFDIDTIAMIPTYIEIEAQDLNEIDKVAIELGLNPEKRKICSANQVYKIYGINTEDYITINFDEQIRK